VNAPPKRPLSQAIESPEAAAQSRAQLAWCNYLQALYLRAESSAQRWPRYEECTKVRTTASPQMLEETAVCSQHALDKFQGDPFTPEYASQVSKCGAAALDRATVSSVEYGGIVQRICKRASDCGEATDAECKKTLADGLGPRLERALGAINLRARDDLRSCLDHAACADVPSQIADCMGPIMDKLLWLPS
jgi:hypothetical protein